MPEVHQIWRSLRDLSKNGIAQETCAWLVENYNKQLQAVVQQKGYAIHYSGKPLLRTMSKIFIIDRKLTRGQYFLVIQLVIWMKKLNENNQVHKFGSLVTPSYCWGGLPSQQHCMKAMHYICMPVIILHSTCVWEINCMYCDAFSQVRKPSCGWTCSEHESMMSWNNNLKDNSIKIFLLTSTKYQNSAVKSLQVHVRV